MSSEQGKLRTRKRRFRIAAVVVAVNLVALGFIGYFEAGAMSAALGRDASEVRERLDGVLDGYEHSFDLFSCMLAREIALNPDPDSIEAYLKSIDPTLLSIEGDSYDGLYLYYQGRYLYSWDTPIEVYQESGYVATERPWYVNAVEAQGEPVFTPPYMSYALHHMLTTVSQVQPDGQTVFAYDIKLGDIQQLVETFDRYEGGQVVMFDKDGTVVGSTDESFLGGDLYSSAEDAGKAAQDATAEAAAVGGDAAEVEKARGKAEAAQSFAEFMHGFEGSFARLSAAPGRAELVSSAAGMQMGYLVQDGAYGILLLVPLGSIVAATVGTWLVPLLIVELLLVYAVGRFLKEQKNRELKAAYVELGQTQRRLEIALSAARRAAAIDDLTGMMNAKSFRSAMAEELAEMDEDGCGVFVMMDGDRFKAVNDTYGHSVGDEVIKLAAQMIVGRIRTVDVASRLHGDEYALYVANASDCEVARRIVQDVNDSIEKEALKRGLPVITLSAGAVLARRGDSYAELSRAADEALYRAKETGHCGGFSC